MGETKGVLLLGECSMFQKKICDGSINVITPCQKDEKKERKKKKKKTLITPIN
jgi:hypothetical protein